MGLYRRKSLLTEAVHWTGANVDEVREFVGLSAVSPLMQNAGFMLMTNDGQRHVSVGDWLIRGLNLDIYRLDPVTFNLLYEEKGI